MLRSKVLCRLFGCCLMPGALLGQAFTNANPGDLSPKVLADLRAHFPDVTTAPAKVLEEEGDLLRIRHDPKDALSFYQAMLSRFGENAVLLNKMGMTHIELRNVVLAESYFRRAVKLDSKNWEGWNNLAAIAYLQRQYDEAVSGYKKSIQLNRANVVSHVNLCTIYFEMKRYDKALKEAAEAVRIDANAFKHSFGLRVRPRALPAAERTRTFFEMAKFFAQKGFEADMLHELAQAHESGMDIVAAMAKEQTLSKYIADPRVTSMIHSVKSYTEENPSNRTDLSSVNPQTAPLAAIR